VLGTHGHQIRGVVGAAALPGRAGQCRAGGVDQACVRVGGDQRDAVQAAGDQVFEEAVPARAGLGRTGGDAEDLAEPVGVDSGGNHDRDLDHPAAFADLHRQRIRGHKRVGPGVQRPFAKSRTSASRSLAITLT
jgi:hypothetical protein